MISSNIVLVATVLFVTLTVFFAHATTAATIELPSLPYSYSALEPFVSQRTLEIHHGKHHAKYVNTLKGMVKDNTKLQGKSLEEIIKIAHDDNNQGVFNNAAQSWNHAFYWKCMTPDSGGGEPAKKSQLAELIKSSFGSFDEFKKKFATAGNTAFGSGWAWLCHDGTKLIVTKTIGAGNPMTDPNMIPILTMDVWEHAYYLDYQNMRTTYVDVFLDKLVNWEFVAENLERAVEEGRGAEL